MLSMTLAAPEDLCLRTIAEFADDVRNAVTDNQTLLLDLSAVAAPDLSVLQLIESARRAAEARGTTLRLAAPAEAPLTALLDRAGFLAAPSATDLQFWFHGDSIQ